MRATADRSIVVLPAGRVGRVQAALAWCGQRPRTLAAAALVALTLLSGLVVPRPQAARADAPARATANVDPPVQPADGLYPLAALPGPKAGPVPDGKGMWLYLFNRAEGGDPHAIVARAKQAGLTHVYVRLGSSKAGFYGHRDLDRLLPAAHAADIKVVGWDFAYLRDPAADVARAKEEIWYATPGGHRIDVFSADIETPAEGTNLTAANVVAYGSLLRSEVPEGYPLIATVPRPSPKRWFPYGALTAFDAVAPMVYWGNRDPAADVAGAIANLAFLGKPVLPVGQAYDMAVDGGPAGAPTKQAVQRFMQSAAAHGARAISFWAWDTATADHWAAIKESSAASR